MPVKAAKISKSSPMPLYAQVKQAVISDIKAGKYRRGDVFPSLAELTEVYQVSMITTRRVLADLASEGYLSVSRGRRPVVASLTGNGIDFPAGLRNIGICFGPVGDTGKIEYASMPWTSNIFRGIQEELSENNFLTTMIPVKEKTPDAATRKLISGGSGFDGIIVMSAHLGEKLLDELVESGRPYVVVNRMDEENFRNCVTADFYAGSARVAEYLVEREFASYLYLTSNLGGNTPPLKLRGFQESLWRLGVGPERIHLRQTGALTKEAGKAAMSEFLKSPLGELPLAVYGEGDLLVIGAMEACRESRIAVPEQVSAVGSTGLKEAETSEPPLTVVASPMREIGHAAAAMLLRMLETDKTTASGIKLKMNFIKRKSVKD